MGTEESDGGGARMTDTVKETSNSGTGVACRTASTTAKVAGFFSIVFLGILAGNFFVSNRMELRRGIRMMWLKSQLQEEGGSEERLGEYRKLDVAVRRNHIWRLEFTRRASYALLGSAVLFLAAAKLAGVLSRQLPRPQHAPDVGVEQIREARRSRWGVTAGMVVLAATMGAGIYFGGPVDFAQAKETGPSFASMEEKREQWHRFRGPGGGGVSVFATIPLQWDGAAGQGILWKTPVPLLGHNSPVVWKERIFLSGATESKREVYCFDATSGKLLWTGDVPTTPAVAEAEMDVMEDTGYSASTLD
jgi:hypothetical protein